MGYKGEFNKEGVYSGTINGNPRGTAVIKKEWVQELSVKVLNYLFDKFLFAKKEVYSTVHL